MKKSTHLKFLFLLPTIIFASFAKLSAQTATIAPINANIGAGQSQYFTITTTGFGADDNDRNFDYTITGPGATIPATPITIPCTSGCDVESHGFSFPTAGTYTISVTVTQTEGGAAVANTSTSLEVWVPNMFGSFSGASIWNFNTDQTTGDVNHGGNLFTSAVTPAALAKNAITGTDAQGSIYYLDNVVANGGTVNLYASEPLGAVTDVLVATADINGASTNDLNFARLGFDATGTGWILAGDGTTLYIASFTGNGTSATTITALGTVTISAPGTIADFADGDLAISGTGVMYAVASNGGGGDTYVYTINSLAGPTYTIERKWKLVQVGGANFASAITGIAFTSNGSVHLSSGDDIYFIDQANATIVSGTIECVAVYNEPGAGFTDLGSDNFPALTILPVKLINFGATVSNDIVTLNWEAENEQNFSHYEVERKAANGGSFVTIGNKPAQNSNGRNSYSLGDNISAINDNVFYYRLKIVDLDGKYNYSPTILVRKDGKNLSGIKVSPNPIITGADATLRFNATTGSTVSIRVIDMTGRIISEQQNRVSQGINSITIHNTNRLQSGMYVLQMINGSQIESTTFNVSH
ncbi:MAG TPA: T9SS type A sorting domain-containing protein [Chitinophagaceae bacterium]|nr:T9SS type A sorting domain-containing protein [Chitinophagaceae bacterium]